MSSNGSSASDGAHAVAAPVVGCAQETTVRPFSGAGPSGTTTRPDTAMSEPARSREWYSTRHALVPTGALSISSERMSEPGAPEGSGVGAVTKAGSLARSASSALVRLNTSAAIRSRMTSATARTTRVARAVRCDLRACAAGASPLCIEHV
ncbi:hypothetical protein JQN58_23175 [Aneurinibacillus sp. BA2021]|nr:hypothetical protein [Aneurinibacillus sp. BA2021]